MRYVSIFRINKNSIRNEDESQIEPILDGVYHGDGHGWSSVALRRV
jgi:hypothetical protein